MRHAAAVALALLVASPALALAAEGGAPAKASRPAGKKVAIKVTADGFQPQQIKVKKGVPTTLEFTRVTEDTCITELDIPAENVKELALPLNKPVSVTVTPRKAGVEKFHCSAMGMGDGKIVVED